MDKDPKTRGSGIPLLAESLLQAARSAGHRRLLALCGQRAWGTARAQEVLRITGGETALWVSDQAPDDFRSMRGNQLHQVLGRDLHTVVFDAHAGFDPDAFGAVAGSLRGGGLLLLLTPPLRAWEAFDDPEHIRIATSPWTPTDVSGRFLRRLIRVIRADVHACIVEQDHPRPAPPANQAETRVPSDPSSSDHEECLTADQLQAVEAVAKVATGHRRRPVVLTSDRGRGKSAAFGIAAARLLHGRSRQIVVTAPSLDAAEPVFRHAHRLLPQAVASRGALHLGQAAMTFVPPDELARGPRAVDLVLVDEAAAIPSPLLERLLEHHARIAFATTVHGYEGTGRGFALRFQQVLQHRTPGWRGLRLETPIRWAANDPVERLVFRALLLDAESAPDSAVAGVAAADCAVEELDRDRLADDEPTLSELFGLLVLAHYRTRPYDLRYLLDGPNVRVYAMRHGEHIVATALVASEGGLDEDIAQAIHAGRRRLRGHLIPQSLAAHAGFPEAAGLHGARIMRIAVHPAVRGRGLGSRLLTEIQSVLAAEKLDWVGSSFGASVELLRFWSRSGFRPLRVGFSREASSGAHAAMVLHPLSAAARTTFREARQRFHAHLPHLLSDPLRQLDTGLAAALLQGDQEQAHVHLEPRDRHDLAAFAFASRGYETCSPAIWKLVCAVLIDPADSRRLAPSQRDALILKVLQKRGWAEVARTLGLSGRKAATEVLRGAVAALRGRFAGQ